MTETGAPKIGAVLFVKNEISDLAFWMAWHLHCGFDTLIIYDDHSDDGTWELITQAAKVCDIRAHRAVGGEQFNIRQRNTYLDALARYRDEFDWLLFLDADEFLEIRNGENVHDFLSHYPEAAAVGLNWCCFGSNRHVLKPPTSNVFEHYTRHAVPGFEYNYTVKSFIRPRATADTYLNPHRFQVTGPYVTTDHQPIRWNAEYPHRTLTLAQWDVARVNHYLIRSTEHYLEKMKRRIDIRESGMGLDLFSYCDRNDLPDVLPTARHDSMMPWLYRIQNQVNRDLLTQMINSCGRGLDGETAMPPAPPSSAPFTVGQLRTHHGTTVCYDLKTGRLCHVQDPESEACRNRVAPIMALRTPQWPDGLFLTTEPKRDTLFLFAPGDPRVSTFLSFRMEEQPDGQISLRNPVSGLLASFLGLMNTLENVEINRTSINDWERLRFVPLEHVPSLEQQAVDVLQNVTDPSQVFGNRQKEARASDEAADSLAADAFIAALSLLPADAQAFWKARNRVPAYPWLATLRPLSV
ncbi:glycosyltransferase family 2 protein [Oecophyllibacter saccharovorans]|uniref:glycosyltransferase family 2 protein n=1 Tax=Oecophyllibacter saccharovorans TaxID=2558360 RepID=UPI00116ADE00|nr:glycosyltransferase family 2 protein [Oecophyllibacter saccharovorans]TPW35205.1 glycosyltransferase family 2 protein [Oecophyllibacter saccharovorans]